jgi:hypothetical protein
VVEDEKSTLVDRQSVERTLKQVESGDALRRSGVGSGRRLHIRDRHDGDLAAPSCGTR